MVDVPYQLSEADRRLAQVAAYGEVISVDAAARTARVRFEGEMESADLHWQETRSGGRRTFSAPSLGERVMVISPSGEPAAGLIFRGLSDGGSDPDARVDRHTDRFEDGALDEYDEADSTRRLVLPEGGRLRIEVGSSLVVVQDGTVTIQSDVLLLGPPGDRRPVARQGDPVSGGTIGPCQSQVRAG